ncbi:conserved protein of unknown function [Ectopseudomonas oleovorans]|uniref:Uncharacterized protein n=1 Tax=Ectopseudomonas oleovorans TaxID=301 RepID=A0A653B5C8_ECTOL|nr:conserved protein of unknown function [Pseudomonas oleovorans]
MRRASSTLRLQHVVSRRVDDASPVHRLLYAMVDEKSVIHPTVATRDLTYGGRRFTRPPFAVRGGG